ncbi:hypothetical protein JHK87_012405 [Glycine soja]|nr:hypothetical protein JHK87_012405 [Glycine soja]
MDIMKKELDAIKTELSQMQMQQSAPVRLPNPDALIEHVSMKESCVEATANVIVGDPSAVDVTNMGLYIMCGDSTQLVALGKVFGEDMTIHNVPYVDDVVRVCVETIYDGDARVLFPTSEIQCEEGQRLLLGKRKRIMSVAQNLIIMLNLRLTNPPNHVHGQQVAAGWPSWLSKIKLADKQAALEKIQWEAMTSNKKVDKLQDEPLCGTNPIIVLKFSMLVLESCPSQTIDLFLSGNIPADMVSSYLKKHSPNMQARTIAGFENRIKNLLSPQNKTIPKLTPTPSIKSRGRGLKKIVAIEGAKDTKVSLSSTDNGRSHGDADEYNEGGSTIMLDEVVDLLSRRWDRINGAQALKLLPKETKLQDLFSFLGPLLRKSNEMYRNCSVIKSLRQSENLHVKDKLYSQRKAIVKITGDSMCSLCHKKIGTSVFAVYPKGSTLVHFVCLRDSQNMKAVGKGSQLRKQL